ncbi:MAG: hypothetical protein Kapaf2KO_11190 [Candidatus Kapaibacteriales bacterium]
MFEKLRESRLISYEFLLVALLLVLFDKIFFPSEQIYLSYVWPLNMFFLGLAALGVYSAPQKTVRRVFYFFFVGLAFIPFVAEYVFSTYWLSLTGTIVYIVFYLMLFVEIVRQVIKSKKVTASLIFGSLCGYLLLCVVCVFSCLLLEHLIPGSFTGTEGASVPQIYINMTYFSMVTVTTIGYGDMLPLNESARLLASFYGIIGQFYMVALVGIIISKYSSKD